MKTLSTNSFPTNTWLFICMSKRSMPIKGILFFSFHSRSGGGAISTLELGQVGDSTFLCCIFLDSFMSDTDVDTDKVTLKQPHSLCCQCFFPLPPIMKCPFLLLQNYQVTFSPFKKITRWLFLLLPGDANLWMEPIWLGAAGEEEKTEKQNQWNQ